MNPKKEEAQDGPPSLPTYPPPDDHPANDPYMPRQYYMILSMSLEDMMVYHVSMIFMNFISQVDVGERLLR
jgi:hypothetical protein